LNANSGAAKSKNLPLKSADKKSADKTAAVFAPRLLVVAGK
jgi:hypothetical protein